jgi:hypothetical protein
MVGRRNKGVSTAAVKNEQRASTAEEQRRETALRSSKALARQPAEGRRGAGSLGLGASFSI